ncbi:leucine-rich repeat flightless-interacting protein 1 isoform X3 [Chamaea fasciata]|uniref:leucine-rich repeat flightless-interacting protein 1 isoform X3 n=1 Tax=Chamaea fasciata TaxID=190680 RepID=UPI00336A20BB
MGTPGAGRKRLPNRERLTAEDDALNQIAREAEARLAAKRAARAEAREIRMKELERQQKEIYQVQKKYYGLDTKWGDIEQWMEDSERYSRRARRNASASDEDERMSVGSRGSLRSHLEYASTYPVAGLESERTKKKSYSKATNGYEEDVYGSSQSRKSSRPSEYSCYLGSGSRASSRASSARASPVIEERPEKDFEKGARTVSSLSAATLASLGGTSSRRGSGDTSISADTEASIREIKDIYELKDQIQDVEGKYMQGLKELKDSLAEVEEKYKKAMVSNAQLDNEKTNFMYQVDTLKDALLELEEQLAESRRQYEEKSKEFEREKHAHSILQFQFMEIKEALKQREEMLAEIQQLQQKQQSYVREISDLQETIEWKDKKIGALERQKDFFDSIRSERDDLRDEVVVLKEQLKKHGIIPDSDIATNGEASDILDNEGHLDSSRTVPGTTQALKTGGEGMLGKANEVEMKNEILEDVGKREILQNTEHEEHKEESEEEEEVQTLHAAENAKAEQKVEERDTVWTVMVPESRFAEQAQSLTEPVSGSTSSSSDSDTGDLRKVTESRGTTVQQPESTEAELGDLSVRTNENLELGSLQGHQILETPQETFCDSGTEQELGEAAPNQEEQEDPKTSHALSDNEMDEGSDSTSESSELVSNQAGLPEGAVAGLLREEGNVESSTPEEPQHSEESAENKVANVLEEKLVDCTDGRSDKTAGDRAEEEEDEVGSTVQGQPRETESVGLEGTEPRERDVPAEPLEKEGGEQQASIQPASSEDSPSASPEEPSTQGKTEDETPAAEKDGQQEELMEELEKCPGSAETGVASVEAGGCIPKGKGSELQQARSGTEVVREVTTQETHLDPSLLDDEIKESELETGDEAGEGQESRTEWVEDSNSKVEVQTGQCSEDTAGGTEGEENVPLEESEVQKVVKQVEGESKEESGVGVAVTTGNSASKETLKENEQEVEHADHPGGPFASEEGANNAPAQKSLQNDISEQVKLEEGGNNSLVQKPVQDENFSVQVKLEDGVNNFLAQKSVQDDNISEQVKLEEGVNNSLAQKPVQDENFSVQVKLEEGVNNSLAQKPVQDESFSVQVKLEDGVNNFLAQKPVQDDNISEQVKLEDQAEESLEDDGDAFDFDEESNQILESDPKCDGEEADTQGEEGDGTNGSVGKTAHTDKAGEGTDKMETKDALTKGEVWQHKKDEPGEIGCLQGETSAKTDEEADVEEDEIKVSDSSKVGKLQDQDVLQQDLESAFIKRAESREDLQGARRSKGRSRDDCTIS